MEKFLKLVALLLAVFFTLMFFFKLYIKGKAKKMEGKEIKQLKDGVIYFYSQGCGACRVMKPQIERIRERVEVMEVDVGTPEGLRLAKEFGIMATPTTLLIKNGIIKKVFVGVVKSERILKEV
ncbi:MAG: thioredoxin family protein [Aquificaceae bacterium]